MKCLAWLFLLQVIVCNNHHHSVVDSLQQPHHKPAAAAVTSKASEQEHQNNYDNNNIFQYTNYWDTLLLQEHDELDADLRDRRKTWSRQRLVASGLSIFHAIAEPDSELWGEKIIRVSIIAAESSSGEQRLRDKFTRGDVLILTPQQDGSSSSSNNNGAAVLVPRECLVIDVGKDWLTAGVGPTWPKGLYEARRKSAIPDAAYRVRLDRTVPRAPLQAQRLALSQLSKRQAGSAAELLANLFLSSDTVNNITKLAAQEPPWLSSLCKENEDAGKDARTLHRILIQHAIVNTTTFQPNTSQQKAIGWALQRRLSLVCGPPGTGKTQTLATLVATYLKLQELQQSTSDTTTSHRVLAVTHSNGAADVLLEALLKFNVPAVRLGRPASVSPSVQHRTVVAIAEKLPEVKRLRQVAYDPALHQQRRSAASFDLNRYKNDAQKMILETAPVVVTSCIGAHQLMSTTDDGADKRIKFSLVVLDEAAQTTEPALVCALAAARADQVVFVGDTQQLPPTVTSSSPELRNSLGLSPMARLEKLGIGQMTLQTQYRMPSVLLEHPSRYFYRGLVRCADNESSCDESPPPSGFPWPNGQPLAFVQVDGTDCEVAHNLGGKSNPTEVALVMKIVRDLLVAGEIQAGDISIISPYSKQVQLLRSELSLLSMTTTPGSRNAQDIRVGTVDSFQGQETGIVIFSAVRSNPVKELGFLRDRRRLCVAITRARKGLILVGDGKVLRSCRHWAALLDSCDQRGLSMNEIDLLVEHGQQTVHYDDDDDGEGVSNSTSTTLEDALDDLLGGSKDDMFGLFG